MGYLKAEDCQLAEFAALTARTQADDLRFAAAIEKNVPIYDMAALGDVLARDRAAVMAEWAWVLRDGPGVMALKGAYADTAPIDAATGIFLQIIEDERDQGGADHFAAAGANDRIWNALQKLCLRAPDVFAGYFGNPAIAAVCEAWLGPAYQMTAQINLVRPGGQAQQAHRDYHLGFMTREQAETFPAHIHDLSPLMTLQGAVAHCDMPVESGPTKLLPFSQLYRAGYVAFTREDFRAHFDAHHIQLPLAKGDAVFFNPALFHAAGENRTEDIHRMANLLQVSSCMGRAMESVDRMAMARALYPALLAAQMPRAEAEAAIAACAEGYAFPTNLDTDPPVDGLAPESQAGLMRRALAERWSQDQFTTALTAQDTRRRP